MENASSAANAAASAKAQVVCVALPVPRSLALPALSVALNEKGIGPDGFAWRRALVFQSFKDSFSGNVLNSQSLKDWYHRSLGSRAHW